MSLARRDLIASLAMLAVAAPLRLRAEMGDHMGWASSAHGLGVLVFWGLVAGLVVLGILALGVAIGRASRGPRDRDR